MSHLSLEEAYGANIAFQESNNIIISDPDKMGTEIHDKSSWYINIFIFQNIIVLKGFVPKIKRSIK